MRAATTQNIVFLCHLSDLACKDSNYDRGPDNVDVQAASMGFISMGSLREQRSIDTYQTF